MLTKYRRVVSLVKCPSCGRELSKTEKSWRYGHFDVEAFYCECGTKFREYSEKGKLIFTLKLTEDGKYRKV
jgi:hypothetical protein